MEDLNNKITYHKFGGTYTPAHFLSDIASDGLDTYEIIVAVGLKKDGSIMTGWSSGSNLTKLGLCKLIEDDIVRAMDNPNGG